ncbi:MAG: hypothetical protein BHV95_00630 [Clostridiales bacterium Nov_37_41]|nr:MAG: hypothetical protein BHV95_00630 [Clostridiales bacterium Nov_37_41]
MNDLFHEQYADIHKLIHLVFLKMSVIGNIVFTRFLMSELIIELSRLRFNSNVRTETVADNILQEANHRFEKVFQIILSDSFSAEILFINNGIRRIKGLRSRS